jgi:hypothetical protein
MVDEAIEGLYHTFSSFFFGVAFLLRLGVVLLGEGMKPLLDDCHDRATH